MLGKVGTIWVKGNFEATRISSCAREGIRGQGVGLTSSLLGIYRALADPWLDFEKF